MCRAGCTAVDANFYITVQIHHKTRKLNDNSYFKANRTAVTKTNMVQTVVTFVNWIILLQHVKRSHGTRTCHSQRIYSTHVPCDLSIPFCLLPISTHVPCECILEQVCYKVSSFTARTYSLVSNPGKPNLGSSLCTFIVEHSDEHHQRALSETPQLCSTCIPHSCSMYVVRVTYCIKHPESNMGFEQRNCRHHVTCKIRKTGPSSSHTQIQLVQKELASCRTVMKQHLLED